jgi:hypothetical protein
VNLPDLTLRRASLLEYFDSLIAVGGDDIAQICNANEHELNVICELVGMSKPLHIMRLKKIINEHNALVEATPNRLLSMKEAVCNKFLDKEDIDKFWDYVRRKLNAKLCQKYNEKLNKQKQQQLQLQQQA